MKNIIVIACLVALTGCSNPDGAVKALEGAGYYNIKITGYSWFSCSQGDKFSTGFTATGPSGKPVKGAVCSGFLKGSTIRTD